MASSLRGEPSWAGPGLTSSAARADAHGSTSLAVFNNDDGAGHALLSSFGGQSIGADCILVKYTWNGDANADGILDGDDYFLIDCGYLAQAKRYQDGDFNFDELITAEDYFLIDSAFIGQSRPLGASALKAAADMAAMKQPAKKADPDAVLSRLFSIEPVL